MKVLLVSTNSDLSGAPIHVFSLVKSLYNTVQFHVVAGEDGPILERLHALGVTTSVVQGLRSSISPSKDVACLAALYLIAKKFKPDLIHAHSTKAGMLARILSMLIFCPCVYTVHGWGWRGLSKISASFVYAVEWILSFTPMSTYIFVSESVRQEGIRLLPISKSRGAVIYNCADNYPVADEPSDVFNILMAARVSPAKDHSTMIRAFEMFDHESKLIFCGAGTDSPDFIKLASLLAPNRFNDIIFLGVRSDIHHLMQNSNVFALISNFEALPISIIEAMSAARGIIASNVGGVKELLGDNVNGILVDSSDVNGVLEALLLLKSSRSRNVFSKNARKAYLERFTPDVMSENIMKIYQAQI